MRQLQQLYQRILDANRLSNNRTDTKTIKIVGEMLKFDLMRDNKPIVPLATTKWVFFKGIKGELNWLLDGDTNAMALIDQNIHIWDDWMINEPKTYPLELTLGRRVEVYGNMNNLSAGNMQGMLIGEAIAKIHETLKERGVAITDAACAALLDELGVPRQIDASITEKGDLGPVYGAQWRNFPAGEYFFNLTDDELNQYIENMEASQKAALDESGAKNPDGSYHLAMAREMLSAVGIDQISQTLGNLRRYPNSRRHIVTAWNPQVAPSDGMSAQENVEQGRAALASCHTLFHFVTEELTETERLALVPAPEDTSGLVLDFMPAVLALNKYARHLVAEGKLNAEAVYAENGYVMPTNLLLDACAIPKYRLNCILYQRSADSFLGLPFNIASYSLLTHMVAKEVNMLPGQFTWMGGDVHLYLNHIEQVKEMISREPYPSPELWLNPEVKSIFEYKLKDIKVINYQHHGKLSGEVAV